MRVFQQTCKTQPLKHLNYWHSFSKIRHYEVKNFFCFIIFFEFSAFSQTKYVAVKNIPLRSSASNFAKQTGVLEYGQPVSVLKTDGSWEQVSADDNSSKTLTGWVKSSNLSARKIVSTKFSASTKTLALAGKGFGEELESQYQTKAIAANYFQINAIVQSFTSLSEKLSPAKLTEVLNIYLTGMTNIILKNGGTIDKYEGDAIIAFWNAPVSSNLHAFQAVKAALECQKFIRDNEEYFKKLCGRGMWTRIGLNTGKAIVGNMGSQLRFDYTMLGDSVNLASRLEGANKFLGTYLLCSESVKAEVEQEMSRISNENGKPGSRIFWRNLGKISVVGKKIPVQVYEPLMMKEAVLRRDELESFNRGLSFFRDGDFKNATNLFEKSYNIASKNVHASTVCAKFIEQCKKLSERNSQDWNGVWVLDEK